RSFARGVGTHAISTLLIHLNGNGKRFTAYVGVDDEAKNDKASIMFYVLGDKKVLWESGNMKNGMDPKKVDIGIEKIKLLGLLVTDAGDGIDYDHADWCDAKVEVLNDLRPSDLVRRITHEPYIVTPQS